MWVIPYLSLFHFPNPLSLIFPVRQWFPFLRAHIAPNFLLGLGVSPQLGSGEQTQLSA